MAAFNPQVQNVETPNYSGYTKPVEGPTPDSSTGMLLQTLGKGIEGGVKIVDDFIKKDIDDNVYKQVDAERAKYTASLEKVKEQQANGSLPAGSSSNDLMDSNASMDKPVPENLEAGVSGIDRLNAARKAGKINDTYYTQQLNSIAKNMRNQYPGYRDYIDEKIKGVTGMDPANAYYRNLMEDINRNNTAAKSAKDPIESFIRQRSNLDGMPEMANLYKAGKIDENGIYEWANKQEAQERQIKASEYTRAALKGSREEMATVYTKDFTKIATGYVDTSLNTLQVGQGTTTAAGAMKLLDDMAADPSKFKGETVQQAVTVLQQHRDTLNRKIMQQANKVDPKTGESFSSVMGVDKTNEIAKSSLSVLDSYISAINNDKVGLGTMITRQNAAVIEEGSRSLLKHPTRGGQLALTAALDKIAPKYAEQFYQQGLIKNLDKDLGGLFTESQTEMATQPNFLSKQEVVTAKQKIEEARGKNVAPGTNYYTNLVDVAKNIANPNAPDELKLNVARSFFHPSNVGMTDNFRMDYVNAQGKQVPGKYSVMTRLSDPDITDSMWKLRGNATGGREVWDNYKSFHEVEFGKLFRADIAQANESFQGQRIKVGWDNDNGRLILKDDQGKDLQGASAVPSISAAKSAIARINNGLGNLKEVYKKEGGDVGTYLLRTLGNVNGELAQNIMKSVVNANTKKTQDMSDSFYGNK